MQFSGAQYYLYKVTKIFHLHIDNITPSMSFVAVWWSSKSVSWKSPYWIPAIPLNIFSAVTCFSLKLYLRAGSALHSRPEQKWDFWWFNILLVMSTSLRQAKINLSHCAPFHKWIAETWTQNIFYSVPHAETELLCRKSLLCEAAIDNCCIDNGTKLNSRLG